MNSSYGPSWELSPLFAGPDDPALSREIAACLELAQNLGQASLSSENFPDLLLRRDELLGRAGRVAAYAELYAASAGASLETEALRLRFLDFTRQLKGKTRAFELAWIKLDDSAAELFLKTLGAHPARHNLAKLRRLKPYVLEPDCEAALEAELESGRSAGRAKWRELIGATGAGRYISLFAHPRAATRARAAKELGLALHASRESFAQVLNALLELERREVRTRGYPGWFYKRAMQEEVAPQALERLLDELRRGLPLVARYYRLKARLQGREVLAASERLAPVLPGCGRAVSWRAGQSLALKALARIAPRLTGLAGRFFAESRIDAQPRPGKEPGAFCRSPGAGEIPFILLNSQGRPRDVALLVHELGHGLHHLMSDALGPGAAQPPFALSEALAVCCELALHENRLSRARSAKARLGALCLRLEDDIATVFRQALLHDFEREIHGKARLQADWLDAAWLARQDELCQGTVSRHEPSGWALTPHFFLVPGYVHVYARAGCLAQALWARRARMGPDFGEAFCALCAAGASAPLGELLAPFGLIPDAPELAGAFLGGFEHNLEQAETLAGLLRGKP